MSRAIRAKCPAPFKKGAGVSLVEILMALFILAIAVLPAIGSFSTFYGVATRQMEQEMALKLGEAVVNVLMTTTYSELVKGTLTNLPLNIQTPSGTFAGTLNFSGSSATSTPIIIGKTSYIVGAQITKVFVAQDTYNPHNTALEFSWLPPKGPGGPGGGPPPPVPPPVPPVGAPPPSMIATYSCHDDLLCILVSVDYGGPALFKLATFRADMTR